MSIIGKFAQKFDVYTSNSEFGLNKLHKDETNYLRGIKLVAK